MFHGLEGLCREWKISRAGNLADVRSRKPPQCFSSPAAAIFKLNDKLNVF